MKNNLRNILLLILGILVIMIASCAPDAETNITDNTTDTPQSVNTTSAIITEETSVDETTTIEKPGQQK